MALYSWKIAQCIVQFETNMAYLFKYLEYTDLDIPNTTNSLEGFFSNLKNKVKSLLWN